MVTEDEVVRAVLAKEGLGMFARELDLEGKDAEPAKLSQLLATVMEETSRLQDWYNQPPEQVSAATECHRLAQEAIETPSDSEELNRRLLAIGYLYSRLTLPGREVQRKLHGLEVSRRAQTSGLDSSNAERKKAHKWMRRFAQAIWEQDEGNCLRTGHVVKKVKEKLETIIKMLNESGYKGTEHWPLSDEAIRREIKNIAPEYASKRGAPKKINNN
jgi:hypothetical protein